MFLKTIGLKQNTKYSLKIERETHKERDRETEKQRDRVFISFLSDYNAKLIKKQAASSPPLLLYPSLYQKGAMQKKKMLLCKLKIFMRKQTSS